MSNRLVPDGFRECECGELVHRSADNHECPGAPSDRIEALENRVEELEERLNALESDGK